SAVAGGRPLEAEAVAGELGGRHARGERTRRGPSSLHRRLRRTEDQEGDGGRGAEADQASPSEPRAPWRDVLDDGRAELVAGLGVPGNPPELRALPAAHGVVEEPAGPAHGELAQDGV